jgi:hypothetical protein
LDGLACLLRALRAFAVDLLGSFDRQAMQRQ